MNCPQCGGKASLVGLPAGIYPAAYRCYAHGEYNFSATGPVADLEVAESRAASSAYGQHLASNASAAEPPLEAVSGGTQEGLEASAAPPHEHTGYVLGCLVCHDLVIEKYTALRGLVTGNATPKEAPPSPDSPSQGERKQQLLGGPAAQAEQLRDELRREQDRSRGYRNSRDHLSARHSALCRLMEQAQLILSDCGVLFGRGGLTLIQHVTSAVLTGERAKELAEEIARMLGPRERASQDAPSSPSSASLESGGGTLDTMGAANLARSDSEER